ncbi:hypothetical protein [Massilia sp. CCM 8734]|uniref:hypothetical protein n=1 Tax=Massilia sp. CCM 8734 TaxID=2609283 RepID=UPI00141E5A28|nr:hypothetical protein [Massilia sp. CCM 8734]NHZ99429.1 hypothetical protein [Massilia sp. CCM 8734]
MKTMSSMCLWLTVLMFSPVTATACTPAGKFTPLTVEQLYDGATYVVYAEGGKVVHVDGGKRITVKILEHFKGPPLDSVPAYENSCNRTPESGVAGVHFLDPNGRGHVMAYPSGQSVEQILTTLRRMKADAAADKTPPAER